MSSKEKWGEKNVLPKCKSKELTINPCTVTHLNPLDQESEWGHPVGFLVPMLALQLTTLFYSTKT